MKGITIIFLLLGISNINFTKADVFQFNVTPIEIGTSKNKSWSYKVSTNDFWTKCRNIRAVNEYWVIGKFLFTEDYGISNPNLYNNFDLKFKIYRSGDNNSRYLDEWVFSEPFILDNSHQGIELEVKITPKGEMVYKEGNNIVNIKNKVIARADITCWRKVSNDFWSNKKDAFRINVSSAEIVPNKDLNLSKTCSLSSPTNRRVQLKVATRDSLLSSEVWGNNFDVTIDCTLAGVTQSYISFTDGTDQNNRTTLLTIDSGKGQATGVKLKVYEENSSEAIQYGPVLSQFAHTGDNNMKRFSDVTGQSNIRKTYKIYYVRDGNKTITPGLVNARLIYNLYYQ